MKTDAEIQKDVMEEFKWEPSLKASEIGVSVKNGVVTLSGTVDSYLKKITAERTAKRVSGVKAVAEDIEVHYEGLLSLNDTEIAQAILNSLKWHSAVNKEMVKVKVENGVVTLDGQVEWEYQRSTAVAQISGMLGVKRIINNIVVKPAVTSKEIKQNISSAFIRHASIDADRIQVDISGDTVTLSGTVRSWTEKNDAERAAWNAKGITHVKNELEVDSEIYAI